MSIIIVWYTLHGHHPADVTERRTQSPWYMTKTEPAFEDMLIKLRRTIIAARFNAVHPAQPAPEEIVAIQIGSAGCGGMCWVG